MPVRGQRENPFLRNQEDLRNHLRNARIASPRAYILIKADEDSTYGMMQGIMDILQDEGATRFNIITDRKTI